MTTPAPPHGSTNPPRPTVARPDASRLLITDLVRSEWTKLRTVRSTYWTLLATAAVMVGLAVLFTASYVGRYDHLSVADRATFNPTAWSLSGFFLAQLAVAVLGVLVMTSEYSTGSIRATFAAAPQRRAVLAAKALVFGAVVAVVGIVASFGAFFVGQSVLASKGIEAHVGDPGVVRSVVGAGLYLTVLGLLGLGLGTLIRRTAGAIAAVIGIVLILPGLVNALPSSWQDAVSRYLPSLAGQALIGSTRFAPAHQLSPWAGFGVFCAYAVIALTVAAVVLARRDT